MATEQTAIGRLASLALIEPGRLSEAEVMALGDAMARQIAGQAADPWPANDAEPPCPT